MKNLKYTVVTILALADITALAVAAIKATYDKYEAEKELRDAKVCLAGEKFKNVLLYVENCKLKNQLEKENEAEA